MVGDRLRQAEMHVSRRKAGKPATHPIRGDELRELRKLRRESTGSFVFVSERGAPFTPASSFLVLLPHQNAPATLKTRLRA
jgi:hypothetical protein